MWIVALLREMGVQWTRNEQERRLFPLCVQVQARLHERYGVAYQTTSVSQVPDAYMEDVKEMMGEILSQVGRGD